jgi:hypothetical protein
VPDDEEVTMTPDDKIAELEHRLGIV